MQVKLRQLKALRAIPANRLASAQHDLARFTEGFDQFCARHGYSSTHYALLCTHGPVWSVDCTLEHINREWESVLVDLMQICPTRAVIGLERVSVETIAEPMAFEYGCDCYTIPLVRPAGITYHFKVSARAPR